RLRRRQRNRVHVLADLEIEGHLTDAGLNRVDAGELRAAPDPAWLHDVHHEYGPFTGEWRIVFQRQRQLVGTQLELMTGTRSRRDLSEIGGNSERRVTDAQHVVARKLCGQTLLEIGPVDLRCRRPG